MSRLILLNSFSSIDHLFRHEDPLEKMTDRPLITLIFFSYATTIDHAKTAFADSPVAKCSYNYEICIIHGFTMIIGMLTYTSADAIKEEMRLYGCLILYQFDRMREPNASSN